MIKITTIAVAALLCAAPAMADGLHDYCEGRVEQRVCGGDCYATGHRVAQQPMTPLAAAILKKLTIWRMQIEFDNCMREFEWVEGLGEAMRRYEREHGR